MDVQDFAPKYAKPVNIKKLAKAYVIYTYYYLITESGLVEQAKNVARWRLAK